MNTGENANLFLKTVHPDCFESCFTWRIVSGGGYVDPEFGIETYYHAPPENEDCGRNPTIEANCSRGNMDRITIGINGYSDSKLAYFDILSWQEGAVVVDGVPKTLGPPDVHFKELNPKYAACRIFHRDCSGSLIRTTAVGLIQQPYAWGHPNQGLRSDRFQQWSYENGKMKLWREYGPGYKAAKYQVLRQHLAPFVDFQMPTGETLAHWLPWYPSWADESQPRAGGFVDVRNAGMMDEGCCNHDLILDE